MKHPIIRFCLRFVTMAVPLWLLVVAYLVCDPFKVLRHYDAFYGGETRGSVSLNPGFVSCSVYEDQHSVLGYDSYIMGNSRSIYYPCRHWTQLLDTCCTPLHMDAAAETLLGICRKLEWIDSQGGEIHHVLMVVDADVLAHGEPNHHNHLLMLAPQLGTPLDAIRFHLQNMRTFLMPRFLFAYTDYCLSGELKPYMVTNKLLDDDLFVYDPKSNEKDFCIMEERIADGKFYDDKRISAFEGAQYPDSVSPQVIREGQLELLQRIRKIQQKHDTRIDWVISPLYDQIRLNPLDVKVLQTIFGKEKVHDFSGRNKWNDDWHNYYETSHYRPHVACEVMNIVYAE